VLCTHVGSLPCSQEVVDFLFARERGGPPSRASAAGPMTRPQCVGEARPAGQEKLLRDIANLKAAMAAQGAARGFMNAASPGVSCRRFSKTLFTPRARPISPLSPR
jgi:hypothetical protein